MTRNTVLFIICLASRGRSRVGFRLVAPRSKEGTLSGYQAGTMKGTQLTRRGQHLQLLVKD